jgi:hypothetical protein
MLFAVLGQQSTHAELRTEGNYKAIGELECMPFRSDSHCLRTDNKLLLMCNKRLQLLPLPPRLTEITAPYHAAYWLALR